MESDVPPDAATPVAPTPLAAVPADPTPVPPTPAPETAHERHTRELEQSVERLEHTVEHRLAKALKIAIPALVGVFLAAIGMYLLGNRLRDRAERRRVARAIRRARSRAGRRALAESIAAMPIPG